MSDWLRCTATGGMLESCNFVARPLRDDASRCEAAFIKFNYAARHDTTRGRIDGIVNAAPDKARAIFPRAAIRVSLAFRVNVKSNG